jgi:mono/diheme cytochrome c family protein
VIGTFVAIHSVRAAISRSRKANPKGARGIMRTILSNRITIATAIAALITLSFVLAGTAQTEVKYADAASYYKDAKCVVCHGQKAEKKFDAAKKDEDLIEVILKGKKQEKPPNMPAYEAKGLTADQAKAMIDFMKSLK